MSKYKTPSSVMIGLTVLSIATALTWAAPLVPGHRKLPDEIRSLALLDHIRLAIKPIPAELGAVGVTHKAIAHKFQQLLVEAGLTITDDPDDPQVRLTLSTITERQVPDAVGFTIILDVVQQVVLENLGEPIHASTYVDAMLGLEPTRNVKSSADTVLDNMLRRFLRRQQQAAAGR